MARNITKTINKKAEEIGNKIIHFSQNYLVPILQEILHGISNMLALLFDILKTKDHSYKASFTSTEEVLYKYNKGFCLDGRRCLARSQPNAIIMAPSGAGKTTCVVTPTLLKADANFIINDPSGEIATQTLGYLESIGYEIKYINFSDATMSNGYNPMARIQNGADANKIAHLLVRSVMSTPGDPFWSIQSTNLISLIIRVLLHEEQAYQNFANVRHLIQLLSANPKITDALIAQTGSEELINDYKSFLSFDVKLRTSIQATCLAALQIFSDPTVAKVTSVDTLNIDDIRKGKQAIFIHCNTADMKYYSTLISIFFEQITKVVMSKIPEKDDRYVFFILDELSSLYLPTLQITAANIRKYKGNLLLILQSMNQLIDVYGKMEADAIRTNCFAKMYFAGLDHYTASELSQQLGKYEWIDEETGKKSVRELRTPDEVRMLPKDIGILICGNHNPMKLHLTPFYNNPFLKLRTQIPIPNIKGKLNDAEVELITE